MKIKRPYFWAAMGSGILSGVMIGAGASIFIIIIMMIAFFCFMSADIFGPFESSEPKPELVDGRTQEEWYELIRAMGKDDYEAIAMKPLDGLERSTEAGIGWNAAALMGPVYYQSLMDEWNPKPKIIESKECEYCLGRSHDTDNCYELDFAYSSRCSYCNSRYHQRKDCYNDLRSLANAKDSLSVELGRVNKAKAKQLKSLIEEEKKSW